MQISFLILQLYSGSKNAFECLTSENKKGEHSIADISKKWEDTYLERHKRLNLVEKKKKTITLQGYYNSFLCLKYPNGLSLVIIDYYNFSAEYKKFNSS